MTWLSRTSSGRSTPADARWSTQRAVAPVRGERVARDAPLDVEVGQPRVDGPHHGVARAVHRGVRGQEAYLLEVMLSMSKASATAA